MSPYLQPIPSRGLKRNTCLGPGIRLVDLEPIRDARWD